MESGDRAPSDVADTPCATHQSPLDVNGPPHIVWRMAVAYDRRSSSNEGIEAAACEFSDELACPRLACKGAHLNPVLTALLIKEHPGIRNRRCPRSQRIRGAHRLVTGRIATDVDPHHRRRIRRCRGSGGRCGRGRRRGRGCGGALRRRGRCAGCGRCRSRRPGSALSCTGRGRGRGFLQTHARVLKARRLAQGRRHPRNRVLSHQVSRKNSEYRNCHQRHG